jgi:sulfatase modifying factor 1
VLGLHRAVDPEELMTEPKRTTTAHLFAAIALGVIVLPAVVPATGNCPGDMARVGDQFCVDRWEASLVQILPDGSEHPWSPYHSPDGVVVRAASARGVVPQGHINQVQAARACRAAGKRLCSDTEWVSACRGPQNSIYPYGNTHEAGRCNEDHRRHPSVELFGHTRENIWDFVHQNHPLTNQLPGTLALTGAFRGCSNEYGVYDMVGNLHEWTATRAGTFRGGYYMDTHGCGEGCSYVTTAHNGGYHDFGTGFRCCANIADGQ